ncbi:MAG: SUMF1/EgtB/PvdO family nonheme iron enzyme [Opitutae bacterium]|nr:SUMF1/EgtB/PvdO family nonheme iron enzyme [Opitutae bacterium]
MRKHPGNYIIGHRLPVMPFPMALTVMLCFCLIFIIGNDVQAADDTAPNDLVLSPREIKENQTIGSVVGKLHGIDPDIFHRNSLVHQGFLLDTSVEEFLDLNQNGQLETLQPVGEQQVNGQLKFSSSKAFKNAGIGITRDNNFQDLVAGYFRARENGIYEFRLNRQDDGAAIWIDLDQDGMFEQDGVSEERVANSQEQKTVYLREGLYMFAVPHVQTTGGASLEVQVRCPSGNSGPVSLSTINPSSNEQDGLWFLLVRSPEDTLSYSLVRGKGDTDNNRFKIEEDKLVTRETFDRETQEKFSIRVKVTDTGNQSYERSFEIEVTNVNDPIIGLEIDENEVPENLPIGSLVAEISAIDPDGIPTKGLNSGLVGYYPFDGNSQDQTRKNNHGTLQGGAHLTEDRFGRDNSALYLDGNGDWVEINGVSDDVKRSVTMATWIQADPATSGTRRSILAVNSEAGTNILLLLIGRRSSDPSLTKKFVIFDAISGGYEAMSQTDVADGRWHHVAYTTNGEVGNFFVDGVREGSHATEYEFKLEHRWSLGQEFDGTRPSDFLKGLLDDTRIYNRILSDAEIKALYETYTYRLVSGKGDDDNASFQILSNMLQTAKSLDYETKEIYSIRIEVIDTDGQSYEQAFQIRVSDANDAPVAITIDKDSVDENLKKGNTMGTLSAIDPDIGDTHTFSLTKDSGEGFSNNLFTISGKTLKTNEVFDFEAVASHRIQLSVRDRAGSTFQQEVVINVIDSNDPPTSVTLDNFFITESAAIGAPVGNLLTTDPDIDDSHTFKISGGADKAYFSLDGAQLVTAKILDFEFQDRLNVTIRTTDSFGANLEQDFEIQVHDANDGPTDIILEPTFIAENNLPEDVVGVFRQVDPDGEWDPLNIPDGMEQVEFLNETFPGTALDEAWTPELTNADSWDHEVKSGQLNISGIDANVHNTDSDGQWGVATLTRPITPLADFTAEWEITWDQKNKPEATQEMFLVLLGANDELIASVGIYDEWIRYKGVKFTSLAENDYMTSIDTLSFKSTGDVIKVTRWGKEMDVRWNDWLFATGQSDIPLAKIQIVFGNYPATINKLDTTFGTESVKRLHISGIQAPTPPTYELVPGEGSVDNAFFSIAGNRLLAKPSFNFEERDSYSIRVKGTDPGELSIEKVFAIDIIDLNDPPSSITLSNDSIAENLKKGTTIGKLMALDEDSKEKFTFKLPSSDDGGSVDNQFFSLSGSNLRSADIFDYESRSEYRPRIRVTDSGGNSLTKDILVKVLAGNDAPIGISISGTTLTEGLPSGQLVGTLSGIDPDPGDKHTFQVSGGADSKAFAINGDKLLSAAILDRESKATLEVTIRVIDQGKAHFEQDFIVSVENANDAPMAITLDNSEIAENRPKGTLIGTLNAIDPDDIKEIILPLHIHHMEEWTIPVGSSIAGSYTTTKDFEGQVLPAINRFFAQARIRFEMGRDHREDVTKRFANNGTRDAATAAIVQGNNPDAIFHGLMDPDLRDPGSHHLYLFPYVGPDISHRAMKQYDSHAVVGQWTGNASASLVTTDLANASIKALLEVMGLDAQDGLPSPSGILSATQARSIRTQAASGRPIILAGAVAGFPARQDATFAVTPLADKEYHLDLGGNNVWVPYAANHSISQPNTSIRRIVILNQGTGGDIAEGWETLAQTLANEARNEQALLVAPQFLLTDQLNEAGSNGLLHWPNRDSQLFGGLSAAVGATTNTGTGAIGPKIDLYEQDSDYPAYPDKGRSDLVEEFVEKMIEDPAGFAFLHMTHPDSVGHGHGWGSEKYHNSIRAVDADLALIFDMVEDNEAFRDDTVIILTADHGGGGGRLYEHTNNTHPLNFTIPFYAWGKGVTAGADLYALNADTRTDPDADENTVYTGESATQPIRNGAIANLSAKLLGLGAVPGSWINSSQDLSLGSSGTVSHVIAISVDGLRPGDIDELGADELPNLFRFRNEGAFTDNARTDYFITRTLPNHSSMLTGRGSLDVTGVGIGHNQEMNHDSGDTLHDNIGAYMHGIFDVAKDAGLRTALFANKSKFNLLNRTWDGSWKDSGGDNNTPAPRITTFSVLDHILDALTSDKNQFPNLEEVVLSGHGDGADFLQRYAAVNRFEPAFTKARKRPVRYVLLAPGSYLHFSRDRRQGDGSFAVPATPPDKYNDYPYGINYLFDYPAETGAATLHDYYPTRRVAYIVGGQDTDTEAAGNSPAAVAQGSNRLERALNYEAYLRETFGPGISANHTFVTLDGIAHKLSESLGSSRTIEQVLGIPIVDSDGDGWTDDDERALATDPLDPQAFPTTFSSTYELVEGEGSTDNAVFRIENGQLLAGAPLDHEGRGTYSVRVRVTDPGGLSLEQFLPIQVTNLPEAPTTITLDKDSIQENLKKGATIGRLSATDDDAKEKHTFRLVPPTGEGEPNDNALFSISGTNLRTNAVLDFDTTPVLTAIVEVTDRSKLTFTQALTIKVTDGNDAPTGVTLFPATIAENQPKGTEVGILTAIDPDPGDTHTYSLVGGSDKKLFAVEDNRLVTKAILDFELKAKLDLVIRVTDKGNSSVNVPFTIAVTDVNDAPTDITLDNDTIAENEPGGSTIGKLSREDPDVATGPTIDPATIGTKLWEVVLNKNGASDHGSIALSPGPDGNIYVGADDGNFYAYNKKSKVKLWERHLGANINSTPAIGSDGTLYVHDRRNIYALDGETGTKKWEYFTGFSDSAPTIGSNGTIYVGGDRKIFALRKNGSLIWEYAGSQGFGTRCSTVAIGAEGNVYFGDRLTKKFTALDGKTGELVWEYDFNGRHETPWIVRPTIGYNSTVYFGTLSYGMYALDCKTGSKVWHVTKQGEGKRFESCPVVGADGTVFLVCSGNPPCIIALDGATGRIKWEKEIGTDDDAIVNSPILGADGTLYVFIHEDLLALDSRNGSNKWKLHFGFHSFYHSSPAIDEDGVIYMKARTQSYWNDEQTELIGDETILYAIQGSSGPATDAPWPTLGQNAQRTSQAVSRPIPGYRLIAGAGDTDNASFTIEGDQLKIAESFDYEAKDEYNIRVKGTDAGGLSIEKILTVYASDINEAPSPPVLSNNSVPENGRAVSMVGKFTTGDPDGDKVALALAPDDEGLDNELFDLKGTTLNTNSAFDYETRAKLLIRIIATDPDGLSTPQEFEIIVVDVNEPPLALALDNNTLEENTPKDTLVGTLSTEDPDTTDIFTYAFVKGEGDTDNSLFQLDKATGAITSKDPLNHEAKSLHSIRVSTTDGDGHTLTEAFAIYVVNVNEPPLTLEIDNAVVRERKAAGTLVGKFTTTDTDASDTHEYALVSGQGGTHNDYFQIDGDELKTSMEIDGKTIPEASILIRIMDAGGLTLIQGLTITVSDSPDPPNGITLDGKNIRKFDRTGTLIGSFTASDNDEDDSHTFAFADGAAGTDNDLFFIDGDQLVSNHMFDDSSAAKYKINVEATDSTGLTYQEVFTITVINVTNPGGFLVDVTKNPPGGGLVAGAGYYNSGEKVTLVVKNSPGYTFSGHTGDVDGGFSADNPLEFNVDTNKAITTLFTEGYQVVTVGVTPERHGYAWGGGSIQHGTEITVEARELDASHGSVFSHWSINGVDQPVDEANPLELKITVLNSMQVLAHFDYGLPDGMKLVPAGTFDQGDERYHGEKPVVSPDISAFYIDEHETTKKDWYDVYNWAIQQEDSYSFMFDPLMVNGRNRAHVDPGYKDEFPITAITWLDAIAFTNALSEMEGLKPLYYEDDARTKVFRGSKRSKDIEPGDEDSHLGHNITEAMVDWRAKGYRLPTESEWEKAARGGVSGLMYPNSNTLDSGFAHYDQDTIIRSLRDVGSLTPNGYGLYDMNGNAWEMCWDWHWKKWYFEAAASGRDPKGPDSADGATWSKVNRDNWIVRTVRGGSGNTDKGRMRISYRKDFNKTWYQYAISLRPAVPAPSDPNVELKLNVIPAHLGTVVGSGVYEVGATATLIATPVSGDARFLRWEDADGNNLGTNSKLNLTLTAPTEGTDLDMDVTAIFEDNSAPTDRMFSLEVVTDPFGAGTVMGGGAYMSGAVVTLVATPVEGNKFAGWSGDASGIDTVTKVTMDGNKKVLAYFGNTTKDTDEDGLSDLYEKSLGTDPEDKDSDDDGLTDGEEMNIHSSNPLLVDTDGDGHDDKTEAFHGTPLNDPSDFPFLPQDRIGLWYVFKGKAYDMAPGRNHGQLRNVSFSKDRFNSGKNALRFTGSKSTVEAGGYLGVSGGNERTVSVWVRGEPGKSGGILYWGSSSKGFSISIDSDGVAMIQAGNGSLSGTTDLMDELWHNIVISIPQDGSLNDSIVYIDNAVESMNRSGSTASVLTTASQDILTIGRDADGNHLEGYIDDIRIWERTLAASEVNKLYQEEKPTAPPEPDVFRPAITLQPAHQAVATGASATFTIEATGKPDPTYTWQRQDNRNWKNIEGETLATLTLSSTALSDATNYRVLVSNSAGKVNSKTARLKVLDPPVFTSQPTDILFATGSNGSIQLNVTGSKSLRFKWFKDGSEIPKATKSKLTLKKVSATRDNGTYQVEVENGAGKVTCDEFNVSVISSVVIIANPTDASFVQGQSGTLTVEANGEGTLTYQWEKLDPKSRKWSVVEGATSAMLTIADVQIGEVGEYRCVVDNGTGKAYSKSGDLGMYIVPVFKTQPRSYSLNEGRKVTLKALATGQPTPVYQWEKSSDDGVTWEDVAKANKAELAFSKVGTANAGTYRVKAINGGGTTTSEDAVLIVYHAPRIINQPIASPVNEGDAINLSVVTESLDSKGTTSTYTWYNSKKAVKDGDGVSGSRSANLSIASASAGSAGSYYCLIKNAVGTRQSASAKVTVLLKPYSTKELKPLSLNQGKTATFSASIQGGKPMTFQWQKDGKNISKQTTNKLSLRGTKASDSGTYSIIATNAAGSLTLSTTLTVAAASTTAKSAENPVELNEESLFSAIEDADNDGLPNLLEYALGSDPGSNESTYSPIVDTVKDGNGEAYLSFSYTENKSVRNVTYIVEHSHDLKTWEPLDLAKVTINRMDRGSYSEVTLYVPSDDDSGFFRVRIE